MMEAWLSASEMTASSGPSRVSNRPALASKQLGNRMVFSIPRNSLRRASRRLWGSWVPQMNRTDDMPKPYRSSASRAASISRGWLASPR